MLSLNCLYLYKKSQEAGRQLRAIVTPQHWLKRPRPFCLSAAPTLVCWLCTLYSQCGCHISNFSSIFQAMNIVKWKEAILKNCVSFCFLFCSNKIETQPSNLWLTFHPPTLCQGCPYLENIFQNFPVCCDSHSQRLWRSQWSRCFSGTFMTQWMLAISSLVPLPFLNPAWTSESSPFMYCWSLAWRILSITLIACEISAIVW